MPEATPRRRDDVSAVVPPSTPPASAEAPSTGEHPTVTPGPSFAELRGWAADDHQAAFESFQKGCAVVTSRTDTSGLTLPSDWRDACAAEVANGKAREFFEQHFLPVVVEDGTGLHTGYYEPEIAVSRTKTGSFRYPIYRRPKELIVVPGTSKTPQRFCARWDGTTCVPYFSRGEIDDGALAGKKLEIAYASDPYELFFMHMQGSGRLRLPDGSFVRVSYDGTNGREWVSIARTVKAELKGQDWPLGTDGIIAWFRAHPQRARAIMREDKSFVFFREIRESTAGPLGAIHVSLTAERSVAADPKFVPLGAPIWLASATPAMTKDATPTAFDRLVIAQDTGGAIRGPNRFDVFFGSGDKARAVAGKMFNRGRSILLLPIPAVTRLFPKTTVARQ